MRRNPTTMRAIGRTRGDGVRSSWRARGALLTFTCLLGAFQAVEVRAHSWSAAEQRLWEDEWRELSRERDQTTSNNFKLVKLEEALEAKAAAIAPQDRVMDWTGVLRVLEFVTVKELGPCVVGEVALSDPVLASPHVLRFVEPRRTLSSQLERDLTNVEVGSLVRATGTVALPVPSGRKRSRPAPVRESFFAKCQEVWAAVFGPKQEAPIRERKPVALAQLFEEPDPWAAALYLDLERLDPEWTPNRRTQFERAEALRKKVGDLETRKRDLEAGLQTLRLPVDAFALEPPTLGETVGTSTPLPPPVRFVALRGDLKRGVVALALPWENLADLSMLTKGLDAVVAGARGQRFFDPTEVLEVAEQQYQEAYFRVRGGETDRGRLDQWLTQWMPDRLAAEEQFAAMPEHNALFVVAPAASASADAVGERAAQGEPPRGSGSYMTGGSAGTGGGGGSVSGAAYGR